jgi:nitroimidazol reductase NimA-like FMN-containing flavoprotein (pyridoxamine 5'-phosphate oxidase superfamily)
MSQAPELRRTDKALTDAEVHALLTGGFAGHLASVGPDGAPYITPLLYVWDGAELWVHNANAPGHFRSNVEADPRVCFEIDQAGEVFPYGRFECDTSVAYRSVVAFGRIRVVGDRAAKQRFCEALMAKYGPEGLDRPKDFFPRLGQITVYAIAIERMSGKHTPLPAVDERWPAQDRSATPNARPGS